jgi:hypothetical protein
MDNAAVKLPPYLGKGVRLMDWSLLVSLCNLIINFARLITEAIKRMPAGKVGRHSRD